jgi:predicted nicotinamide N-methyase
MAAFKTHQLAISDRQIVLDLPSDPEALLEVAAETEQSHDPYWGILWDAAIPTAECVLKFDWPRGAKALELGCGAGLVGIAGLMAGLDVTFSDVVQEAVDLAARNAAANGFSFATGRQLDVRSKPTETFDVLMASDILYDRKLHLPLLDFAGQALAPEGVVLLGDPGRQNADVFALTARQQDWLVEELGRDAVPAMPGSNSKFKLLKLTREIPAG